MPTARLILMLLAVVLLALAAMGIDYPRRNLMAAGLACWAIAATLT